MSSVQTSSSIHPNQFDCNKEDFMKFKSCFSLHESCIFLGFTWRVGQGHPVSGATDIDCPHLCALIARQWRLYT